VGVVGAVVLGLTASADAQWLAQAPAPASAEKPADKPEHKPKTLWEEIVLYGFAGYVAYDWTERLHTASRGEYFRDADGARTLALGPGSSVLPWEITATLQYKIWRGLVGHVEFRHDQANEKAFKVRAGASADQQEPGHDHAGLALPVVVRMR
jgi:Putative beta-barrel porin-2, OmpL-like. bbp2